MAQAGEVTQVPDTEAFADDLLSISRARGYRSMLFTPLMDKGFSIGFIAVTRVQAGTFADHHVQLLRTFADQAVIAIENVRLFEEVQARTEDLRESLEQQTATADVLKVISRSAFDLRAVLDTLVSSAARLCNAEKGVIYQREGNVYRIAALFGFPFEFAEYANAHPIQADRSTTTGRVAIEGKTIHIPDVLSDPDYTATGYQNAGDYRTTLGVPLFREGTSIGSFSLVRSVVNPFTQRQIELVETFADQAVIAIENARLFGEVQAKTRDLSESLQQQTATSEVLKVISSSPGELQPVFSAMLKNAVDICDAKFGNLFLVDRATCYWEAGLHTPPELVEYFTRSKSFQPTPGSHLDRVMRTKQVSHTVDDAAEAVVGAAARLAGARSTLCVPMIKDAALVGAIFIYRTEVRPFTEKQIDLVKNFASQAVIAIENTRLLSDLRQSLQQQTATAEVLKVISRSAFDLQTVLQTLVESAAHLCEAEKATITRQKDGVFYRAEAYGFSGEFMEYVKGLAVVPDRGSASGRALLEGVVVHIPDVRADPDYTFNEAQRLDDFRTILGVPMMREGKAIGVIVLTRTEPRPFTDKQMELATTFADQAAIAIENVRLFESVEARTRELAASLEDLRTAQDRLIQTEKLASLGQLTAGIAHEIKNPLNFVNNFAALSAELTDELNETLEPEHLSEKARQDVDELTVLLKNNLSKVVQHGKRADSIVKNMLLHSREGSGEHRSADINAIVEDSLNLAYHGARAEKSGFTITLRHDLDPQAGAVELYPQEITRALLNLISNGFYAATKRKSEARDETFEPTLSAATKNLGNRIEIRIRDNGTGIPPEVKEKMFNPFFTTKPAGEGTGLGLSMSHDIIVKQHGGNIDVDTEPGVFTEFIITLPRNGHITSDRTPVLAQSGRANRGNQRPPRG
jgi:GAF domain-containing protein